MSDTAVLSNIQSLTQAERKKEFYRQILVEHKYSVSEAARHLGLTRAQFAYRIKRYKLI